MINADVKTAKPKIIYDEVDEVKEDDGAKERQHHPSEPGQYPDTPHLPSFPFRPRPVTS